MVFRLPCWLPSRRPHGPCLLVVLTCERGGLVLTLDFHSPPTTTRKEVCFLDLLNQCNIPCRVPGAKPTPDDWFDIVKLGDSTNAADDDRLEYQRPLQVPAPLNHSNPEVGQRCEEAVSLSAVGEVVQWQGAGGDMVIEPLPLCILSGTNPTIKVGSIIEWMVLPKIPRSRQSMAVSCCNRGSASWSSFSVKVRGMKCLT
jgi:hypothetical protein